MARKNIYMNPPLEQLLEETQPGKFSRRLGEVVERYNIMLNLTDMPELTSDEIMILSEVICGSVVNATMVRAMHLSVLDAQGNADIKNKLSKKLEQLSPTQRLKLIELKRKAVTRYNRRIPHQSKRNSREK